MAGSVVPAAIALNVSETNPDTGICICELASNIANSITGLMLELKAMTLAGMNNSAIVIVLLAGMIMAAWYLFLPDSTRKKLINFLATIYELGQDH